MSQQTKQLEDRISRLEIDVKQLRQVVDTLLVDALRKPVNYAVPVFADEPKRGPGRPKKEQQ